MTSKALLEKLCDENLGALVHVQSKQIPLYVNLVHRALIYSDLPTYRAKMNELFPNPTAEQIRDINQSTLEKSLQLLIDGKFNSTLALNEWKSLVPTINLDRFLTFSMDSFIKQVVERQTGSISPEVLRFFQDPAVKKDLGDTYDIYVSGYRRKPQYLPRFESIFGPGK